MKNNIQVLDDGIPYGVYVWKMPDGRWIGDEDGNFLSIASMNGDIRRIAELTRAVRSYGIEEGGPEFLAGRRKISDEEYRSQLERHNEGLTPDELDVPALVEELVFNDRNK